MRALSYSLMAGAALALPPLPADAAPRGSYLQTCREVGDTGGRNGEVSAQCPDAKGRYRYSSLRYRGCQGDIANVNGQLSCEGGRRGDGRPSDGWGNNDDWNNGGGWGGGNNWGGGRLPAGSWTQSCRNFEMRGTVLTAECKSRKRWVDTRIDVRSCRDRRVANQYGNLVCEN